MKGYYVTVVRGKRVGWLAGPYWHHDVALMLVEPVRRIACKLDPWCDFDAFGTSSIDGDHFPPGTLNKHL